MTPALGVAVADVEQRYTVYESVHPQNLIDGQLADDVLVEAVLVVAADADLQVPDVIVQVRAGNRGAELAVQAHQNLQRLESLTDGPQIPFSRPLDGCLAVRLDHHIPKRPVNPVVLERLHGLDDPLDDSQRHCHL
jgi:hypothetical protein